MERYGAAVNVDFIYLYRPVRPVGEGTRFYETLADTVARGGEFGQTISKTAKAASRRRVGSWRVR